MNYIAFYSSYCYWYILLILIKYILEIYEKFIKPYIVNKFTVHLLNYSLYFRQGNITKSFIFDLFLNYKDLKVEYKKKKTLFQIIIMNSHCMRPRLTGSLPHFPWLKLEFQNLRKSFSIVHHSISFNHTGSIGLSTRLSRY